MAEKSLNCMELGGQINIPLTGFKMDINKPDQNVTLKLY